MALSLDWSNDSILIDNNIIEGGKIGIGTSNSSVLFKKINIINNTIRNNADKAAFIIDNCHFSKNSIYDNGYGIYNYNFSNDSILPPLIDSVYATGVKGTSRPNAVIELYYSQSQNGTPQGKTYIATVTADTIGRWKYTGAINLALNVTATQTTNGVNTSEFAAMLSNVWPGDINYDLTVDNLDFLYLNIATGDTGAVRKNASINWLPQPCRDWKNKFASGINHKHADCNGNGIVTINDSVAITQNYSLTHPAKPATISYNSALPDLSIVIANDTVAADSTFTMQIFAGDSLFPIDSIYGIAFSVLFDPTLIDTTKISYNFSQSGLGVLHSDLESFHKSFYASGKLDFALCRTNHLDTSNFSGLIGTLTMKTKSNVPPMSVLQITPSNIIGLTHSEKSVEFNAVADSVILDVCQGSASIFTGQQTYCIGDMVMASAVTTYTSQTAWYIDSTFIANDTLIATDTLASGNHTITMNVVNAFCNFQVSQVIYIHQPIKPTIFLFAYSLYSSSMINNQWYLNGAIIPGATQPSYAFLQDGWYGLSVIDTFGCAAMADSMYISTVGIPVHDELTVSIFPNPMSDEIKIKSAQIFTCTIMITDAMGKLIYKFNGRSDAFSFLSEKLSAGIYNFNIRTDSKVFNLKLVSKQ
jgi:hypothetical protein